MVPAVCLSCDVTHAKAPCSAPADTTTLETDKACDALQRCRTRIRIGLGIMRVGKHRGALMDLSQVTNDVSYLCCQVVQRGSPSVFLCVTQRSLIHAAITSHCQEDSWKPVPPLKTCLYVFHRTAMCINGADLDMIIRLVI